MPFRRLPRGYRVVEGAPTPEMAAMQRIRIHHKTAKRREPPGPLPLDARDPDVARAKALRSVTREPGRSRRTHV